MSALGPGWYGGGGMYNGCLYISSDFDHRANSYGFAILPLAVLGDIQWLRPKGTNN